MRMLARCPSWLIGAAIVAAAQLLVAPIRAQTPDYRLDSSGLQVISLFNLSPGECYATSISGRIVKREFDARGVVPSGVSVEVPSGERSFINIDQYALAQLSNVARSWIITGLQTLLNEGREVTLAIKLCGAGGRVAYLDAVAAPSTPPIPSRSPNAIGPSFDCGTKTVSEQPLAQMICANRELAYWELSYVVAYQALREAALPDQRKAMVAEANALVLALEVRCELPKSGALQRPPTEQEVNCIKALFQQEKRTQVERAMGMAREEALLEPADTIAIQQALQAQAYLSRTDAIDGVFGPVTRKAISAWQRDHVLRESGFASKALLQQLASSSRQGTPPAAPPPDQAAASTEQRDRSALSTDRSGKTNSIKLTLSDGADLRPKEVFEKVSGAVYIVKVEDALGSAVAIGDRELLTNCHVVGNNSVVSIEREGVQFPAAVVSANSDANRCVLSVPVVANPLLKWVRVRPYADIKVGERVFTVGAPQGLELTLADGMVSSKRAVEVGRFLQTSAPISKGSSGGGLFDAQGNLLGITTFMIKDAQNLNFAIAAEEYAK
jgi:S1-C subfamily serine protease